MADFNQDPAGQATTALELPTGLTAGSTTGTISFTIYSFVAESDSSVSLIMLSQPPLPEPTTSLPTSGQIWPLGFIEIGYPPVPDDFNIWLF